MEGMTRWRKMAVAVLAVTLAVAACGAEDTDAPTTTVGDQTQDGDVTSTTLPDRTTRDPSDLPERVPGDSGGATVTGEVPAEYLAAVVDDAAERAGVDPSAVTVITAQEMIWPDGSLDCGEPGGVYTHAQVPGYWVIVEASDVGFDYRLTGSGAFMLCTSPFPGGGGGTAPTE